MAYTREMVIDNVPALSHNEETEDERDIGYEISHGHEKWAGKKIPVIKVRMTHNGKAKGYSASFPDNEKGRQELRDVCNKIIKYLDSKD